MVEPLVTNPEASLVRNQVQLFGRPGGSAWAEGTFVNLAPASTPATMAGKAVAGVPQGWEQVSPSILQQVPPASARITPVPREVTISGGVVVEDSEAVAPETAAAAAAVQAGVPRPTGVLMNAYANTAEARTMQAYINQASTATATPGSYDDVVSQYRANHTAFNATADDIQDLSPEVSGRWNFGTMSAPNALVVHHTAGRGTVEGVVQTFTERNFPAHFVIDREGNINQILGLNQKGQHTRPAQDGSGITNSNSWGVEVIAKDDSDVLPAQAAATIRLTRYLQTYGLDPSRVVGHGAINAHKQATEGQSIVELLRQING